MIVGVDAGYGWTKAVNASGTSLVIPTLVSAGRSRMMAGMLGGQNIGTDALHLMWNGREYFIGELARTSRSVSAVFDKKRYTHQESLMLIDAVVSLLMEPGESEVVLMTGVPFEFYAAQAEEFRNAIIASRPDVRWLEGPMAGMTFRWSYQEAIVLPQGLGALFAELLGPGGVVVHPELASPGAMLGLIDCGRRTTDFLIAQTTTAENGLAQPIDEYSGTIDAGVADVERYVAKAYSQKTGGEDIGTRAERAVRTGSLIYGGELLDLSEERDAAVIEIGSSIADRIQSIWGTMTNQLDAIFLAGGGAVLFQPVFERSFPKPRLVDQPQLANANGYLRIGEAIFGITQSQPHQAPQSFEDPQHNAIASRDWGWR